MKMVQRFAVLVILLILAACASPTPPPAPTLSISCTPSSISGGGTSTCTATLTNATTAINWSVSGGGTVAPATGTTTTYTAPATVATTFTATVSATSGSLSANATITVNPPATITINGTVIGSNFQPVASAPVVITFTGPSGTTNLSTNTNSSGVFSASGVIPPYDASVVSGTSALVYKGLTRTDPTLVFLGVSPGAGKTATLSGTISGGAGFPEPANHQTRTAFGSPEATDGATANTATGAYNMGTVSWFGPTTTTGNIHALQWLSDGTGLPTDYKGYGSKTGVALSDGGTFSSQNITMSGVTEASIGGTVTLPGTYTLTSKRVSVGFADRSLISVFMDSGASTNFTYTTPSVAGATLQMRIAAQNAVGTSVITTKPGLAVNATGVALTVPAGSDLSLPPNAATNVNTSTTFSYTPFSGGVHFVVFNSAGPDYVIVTSAASTTIPNLSSVGLGLPAATNYTWSVVGASPFASVDAAAAAPSGWINVFLGVAEGNVTTSATRTFTTAP